MIGVNALQDQFQAQTQFTGADEMRRKLESLDADAKSYAASSMDPNDKKQLMEACESFESYFLQMLFREMRKTLSDEDGLIPKSNAEKIFTDLLDEETSKNAARAGGMGLAQMMYKQMTGDYSSSVPRYS